MIEGDGGGQTERRQAAFNPVPRPVGRRVRLADRRQLMQHRLRYGEGGHGTRFRRAGRVPDLTRPTHAERQRAHGNQPETGGRQQQEVRTRQPRLGVAERFQR